MRLSGAANPIGAPGRIRTYDLKLRRLVLYPTELRARDATVPTCIAAFEKLLVRTVALRLAAGEPAGELE